MSEVSSEPQIQDNKSTVSPNKLDKKPKAHSLGALTSELQGWQPSDPLAMRRQIVNEAMMLLDKKSFTCTKACIPAIVVDNQFPVDLLHYQSSKDVNEFVERMLWMHREFNSAIGILLGIPKEQVAAVATEVQEALDSFMVNDDGYVVLLR